MNPLTEISPSTQLLDEIRKIFDKYEAKWDRRFTVQDAACEASLGVLVLSLSAVDGFEVVANNWGGFFEQPVDIPSAPTQAAAVVADNWGGLFEQPADNCSDNWGGLFEQPAHILEELAATDAANGADITLEFDPADHGLLPGAGSLADIQVHQFTSTNPDAPLAQCGPVDIEYIPTSAAFSTSSFITVHASILTREEFVSGKGGDATTYPAPNAAIFADQIRYNANAEPDPEPEAEASVGRSTQMMLAKGQILSVSSSPIVSNPASSSGPARQVFEELLLHADIFCNICIGFELPSRMSLGVNQHQPWPPPDELRLTGCDAELRPTPWPSFYMAVRNFATGHPGRL